MRRVYRHQGLVRRHGPGPVDIARQRALETKIASMPEKATENAPTGNGAGSSRDRQ